MNKTLTQQKKALKAIVQQSSGTSLFAHLGLVSLKKFRDFDLLQQSFSQSVPVHTVQGFQNMLTHMTRIKGDAQTEVVLSLIHI